MIRLWFDFIVLLGKCGKPFATGPHPIDMWQYRSQWVTGPIAKTWPLSFKSP